MNSTSLIQDLRGVMTRFEPLTADSLAKAVPEELTFAEFSALMQSYDLSLNLIVHDPTRHYLNTFYADYQYGRYLELYLNNQYLREVLPERLRRFPK